MEHDPTYPMRPILYFFGDIEGSSMNDQVNRMNGQVKMTVDNQVQWSFVSVAFSFVKSVERALTYYDYVQISGNQDNAIWRFVHIHSYKQALTKLL